LFQVLLATGGGYLVYLEIRDAKLIEVKHAQLEHEISCLDLNPVGENSQYSSLATIGMWTDISVRIFSLPDLELVRKETLGGEIVPRFVLLCTLEGVCSMFLTRLSLKTKLATATKIYLPFLFRFHICFVLLEMVICSVLC
jgi:hypothetical protein